VSTAAQALGRWRAFPGSRALHAFERAVYVYRRVWRGTLFLSFFSPILYLAAMGLGLGAYIDQGAGASLPGGDYLAFLAPGLVAAQAMNVSAFECTYPVLGGILWNGHFIAMLATPARIRDILAAHFAYLSVRIALVSVAFLLVVWLFGAGTSPLLILSVPIAVLTGLAFGGPITAYAANQKSDSAFSLLFRFGITPMFLFSGTFFPVERLPALIQPIAWITPLFHGVALARGLALGSLEPLAAVGHVGVLVAYAVVGAVLSGIVLQRRLLT
jgi:lipooligosaccharide transport system permease protein